MSGRDSGIGAVIDHHTNTAAIEHPSWFPTMGSATADHARVFPGNDNPLVSFIGGGVGAAIASHIGHRHTVAKAILGAMLGRAVARHLEQVRHPVTSLPPAPLDEQNRSPTPGRY
jgi:hypothetical protein